MTEQKRKEICAELARRMGYFVAVLNGKYGLQSASKIIYTRWREAENEAWMDAPDPFTDAADNRELVKWLAADDARWQSFTYALWSFLPKDFNHDYVKAFALMSYEVITLAAAKTLGIENDQ